jgi:putative CocE/NonD family hydrolase
MVGGWQDIFLPFQIRDFVARQDADLPTWLTIGPWSHAALRGLLAGVKDAAEVFAALRRSKIPHAQRGRVRLYLQQAGEWRDYRAWPPPEARPLELYLHADGSLSQGPPAVAGAFVGYVYDPADPTPSLHGPMVMGGSRRRDMSKLEARADTVSFTGPRLEGDLDAIGPVTAELSVQSDREHTDFFVCLCDVDGKGRPTQVCDGFLRLRPGQPPADHSGTRRITIECWPTAYRFRKGHRLRLIVASGAFPRFARNLGTGEPHVSAIKMVPANQKIMLGNDTPSLIRVSVMPRE